MVKIAPVDSQVPAWLTSWFIAREIALWGMADLRDFDTPGDTRGVPYPQALSFAIPMNPAIMASIQEGPNRAYAAEYARVNTLINKISKELAAEFTRRGFQASSLPASERTDPVGIKGDFPHKTAATRAGLGWIGRHCQLVTRPFGPWVRLGTVFLNGDLPVALPREKHYCGKCTRCVEACPAGALTGNSWYAGISREEILDVTCCDHYKKKHYREFHEGHNCGICAAVCPFGLKNFNDADAIH